jgi:hypothetical protein
MSENLREEVLSLKGELASAGAAMAPPEEASWPRKLRALLGVK